MGRYPTKKLLFDIFSLANQLYQSKSIILKGFKPNKMYFSKNPILNFLLDKLKALFTQIEAFNKFIKENKPIEIEVDKDKNRITSRSKTYLIKFSNIGSIKMVNKLFF